MTRRPVALLHPARRDPGLASSLASTSVLEGLGMLVVPLRSSRIPLAPTLWRSSLDPSPAMLPPSPGNSETGRDLRCLAPLGSSISSSPLCRRSSCSSSPR